MQDPAKDPRLDAKLQNLGDEDHEFLWDFRFKENGRLKNTLRKVQAEVPLRYGFTISTGQLSTFYKWLKNRRNWADAAADANQAKDEFLKEHPGTSTEDLMKVGQLHFMARSMRNDDGKTFISLVKAITARERIIADREKAQKANQTKIDAGLDALLAEIQGNPKALKLFTQLREVVSKV